MALTTMRLAEEGVVDLDADVSEYLGWQLRHPTHPDTPVTLRQLLDHRSGLRDSGGYVISLGESFEEKLADPASWYADAPPGEAPFAYSNLGSPVVASVIEAASVSKVPVISTDIVPTLIEVAGLPTINDHPVDGESLVPLLKQAESLQRDAIYFHYPNYAFHKNNRLGSAVRQGDYKLIKWYDDGSVELYDLVNDLGEQKNLAEQKPKLAEYLETKLDNWLKKNNAKFPAEVSATPQE